MLSLLSVRSFLTIDVGPVSLALAASAVDEVLRAVFIAPVPSGDPLLEGVINLRGTVVPVLDIRTRLRLPARELTADQFLVIAQAGSRQVALRVDGVGDLVELPENALRAPATELQGDAVAGIARTPDGVLIVFDLDAFLTVEQGQHVDATLSAWPA